jgi:hypothetical protein
MLQHQPIRSAAGLAVILTYRRRLAPARHCSLFNCPRGRYRGFARWYRSLDHRSAAAYRPDSAGANAREEKIARA